MTLRRILRILNALMWLAPAILLAIFIRIVRPLVLVRFGRLASQRIGHYICEPEIYLCQLDADPNGRRILDFFYNGRLVCNTQLKKMWDRALRVSKIAIHVDRINRLLPGSQTHTIPMPHWDRVSLDLRALIGLTKPHLGFTADEEEFGLRTLREIGIPEEIPFVCFHARDSSYLNESIPQNDWRYQNYRDADVQNYLPAMERLGCRGYLSLRMGAVTNKPLTNKNPSIIDYANTCRTDFLDLFLSARCRFFIGSHTGLMETVSLFRQPTAIVNLIPYEMITTWGADDLFIPKKLWLTEEGRYMTFREIFETGTSALHSAQLYQDRGLQVVENTPEEITAVAVEMDERLNGVWQSSDEDQYLQERFWSVYQTKFSHGPIVSRIGAEFLRQNQALLE